MHKKVPVVDFTMDRGDIIAINQVHEIKHLPMGVEQYSGKPVRASLNQWWQNRSIPASRSGLREGLGVLGVAHQKELLDKSYGLSLSDQYWISPKDAPLNWDSINFFDHEFSDDVGDALFGIRVESEGEEIDYVSPCSASDGWLKKKWKIVHGERVLIKGGSGTLMQEPYNEVIASLMHKRLGIVPFTDYELLTENRLPYSICKNFITKDMDLVPAIQMINSKKKRNDISYYEHLSQLCYEYGIHGYQGFVDYMITTDFIIANTDRHYNNFGFIRDANSLVFTGIAPIYDSGTSLWYQKADSHIRLEEEIEAKPFKAVQSKQIRLVSSFGWLDLSKLKGFEEEAAEVFAKSDTISPQRSRILCDGIRHQLDELEKIAAGKR